MRYTASQRAGIVATIRQLNDSGWSDVKIGDHLGLGPNIVRNLRNRYDIPPIAQGARQVDRECPVCTLAVTVTSGRIDPHRRLVKLRIVREGQPTPQLPECPGSRCRYEPLAAAIEERKQQVERAA